MVRKDLNMNVYKLPDRYLKVCWKHMDRDNSGFITLNEFAGLLRRYSRFGNKAFKQTIGLHKAHGETLVELAHDDAAGHAARVMDMADRFVKNDQLTYSEMSVFLKDTQYQDFLNFMSSDRAREFKLDDTDKSMSIDVIELEAAYTRYIQFKADNAKGMSSMLKTRSEASLPGDSVFSLGKDNSTSQSVRNLREYVKIGGFTSINQDKYASLGTKPRSYSDYTDMVNRMQSNLTERQTIRNLSDATCANGEPRYQLTKSPIKSYSGNFYMADTVKTKWGGERSRHDTPQLIKRVIVPPSEQEFIDQLKEHDKAVLWRDTLDPELHWSDRLHQSSTSGNLIHLKIRTEEQRHRQLDCLHSGTH